MAKEVEWARCGNTRIQLPQGTGGSVARVGERRLTRLDAVFVEPLECPAWQNYFSADFQEFGHPIGGFDQPQGYAPDSADILGHILAVYSITASGADYQLAVFVN